MPSNYWDFVDSIGMQLRGVRLAVMDWASLGVGSDMRD